MDFKTIGKIMGYYKKRRTSDWRTNKNYQNRFRKNQPVEHPLGSWANPYPAGPFDPNNVDKISFAHSQVRYRGTTSLTAYRKDIMPESFENDYGDYLQRVEWQPEHEKMFKDFNVNGRERINGKLFKSSLENASFDLIKECYVLFRRFSRYTD